MAAMITGADIPAAHLAGALSLLRVGGWSLWPGVLLKCSGVVICLILGV